MCSLIIALTLRLYQDIQSWFSPYWTPFKKKQKCHLFRQLTVVCSKVTFWVLHSIKYFSLTFSLSCWDGIVWILDLRMLIQSHRKHYVAVEAVQNSSQLSDLNSVVLPFNYHLVQDAWSEFGYSCGSFSVDEKRKSNSTPIILVEIAKEEGL